MRCLKTLRRPFGVIGPRHQNGAASVQISYWLFRECVHTTGQEGRRQVRPALSIAILRCLSVHSAASCRASASLTTQRRLPCQNGTGTRTSAIVAINWAAMRNRSNNNNNDL